jgi:hypothetical protein
VEPVEGMGMKIGVEKARTPDVTHYHHLISLKTHVLETAVKGVSNALMRATRTEYRGSALVQETRHDL